jgi:hypothetical protein
MEDHREVRFDHDRHRQEVVHRVAGGNDAVELLPEHKRPGGFAVQAGEVAPGPIGRAFEEQPIALRIGRELVEIPPQAALLAALGAGHRQPSALRKRCGLQTHAEAPEVMGLARGQRVLVAEPHRAFELRVAHAAPVIEDQNAAVRAIPLEINSDLARAG